MTWREAMRAALYGPAGFYARGEPPSRHFRTSVHVSSAYAGAMLVLLRAVDATLGHPGRLDLVDVGAGRGELLVQLLSMLNEAAPDRSLATRIAVRAVEITPRPAGLDPCIRWQASLPTAITGLVIASEWLDNIPLDVVELTPDGPRLVLVETESGAERPGPPPRPADLAWARAWWPLHSPGDRAEIGRTRGRARGARRPRRVTRHHGARRARRVRGGRPGGAGDHHRAHHPAPGAARAGGDRPPAPAGAGGRRPGGLRTGAVPGGGGSRADRRQRAGRIRLAGPGRGAGHPGAAGGPRPAVFLTGPLARRAPDRPTCPPRS